MPTFHHSFVPLRKEPTSIPLRSRTPSRRTGTPGFRASPFAASTPSGETEAHRIVFEFDKVEQIKSFNPGDQTSVENFDELVIYPAKEVIWDNERIAALGKKLASLPEFTDGGKKLLEHLDLHGTVEGEELFFPVAFDKSASVLDYLDPATATVFFLDFDRQENAQESLEREYLGLYRKLRGSSDREGGGEAGRNPLLAEVPEPVRELLSFRDLSRSFVQRRGSSFRATRRGVFSAT